MPISSHCALAREEPQRLVVVRFLSFSLESVSAIFTTHREPLRLSSASYLFTPWRAPSRPRSRRSPRDPLQSSREQSALWGLGARRGPGSASSIACCASELQTRGSTAPCGPATGPPDASPRRRINPLRRSIYFDCVRTNCGHRFCAHCISRCADCPVCGADISDRQSDAETQGARRLPARM